MTHSEHLMRTLNRIESEGSEKREDRSLQGLLTTPQKWVNIQPTVHQTFAKMSEEMAKQQREINELKSTLRGFSGFKQEIQR